MLFQHHTLTGKTTPSSLSLHARRWTMISTLHRSVLLVPPSMPPCVSYPRVPVSLVDRSTSPLAATEVPAPCSALRTLVPPPPATPAANRLPQPTAWHHVVVDSWSEAATPLAQPMDPATTSLDAYSPHGSTPPPPHAHPVLSPPPHPHPHPAWWSFPFSPAHSGPDLARSGLAYHLPLGDR